MHRFPTYGELKYVQTRLDTLSAEDAIKRAEQAAHAADFVVKRSTDEGVSPDAPVLRLEVPERPINADSN